MFIWMLPMVVQAESTWDIETADRYIVYSEPNKNSTILLEGTGKQLYKTTGMKQGFYEVTSNGTTGYIHTPEATSIFDKQAKTFEIIDNSVPYYVVLKGEFIQRGTIHQGAIINRTKSMTGYHIVEVGTGVFYVPTKGTAPTSQAPIASQQRKAKYPMSLTNPKEVAIFDKNNRQIGSLKANSSIKLLGLSKGKGIISFLGKDARIPMGQLVHSNLLQPKKVLRHDELSYFLQVIAALYPNFTKLEVIGKSIEGKEIHALRVGNGKREVLIDGAMHAREHMTTNLLAEMIDTYTLHYKKKSNYSGYNVHSVLNQTSIWFVPMMNPDGVTLVQSGPKSLRFGKLATQINGSTNFNRWKANIRGVDLNDNFASKWETIKGGNKKPAYMAYKGFRVFSEPESRALRDFVKKHNFKTYISYHSSGQVMYWFNYQNSTRLKRDRGLATKLSNITGYRVMPPQNLPGSGSSADWFIQETKNPGITLEISPAVGERPVPLFRWDTIWKQNKSIGLFLAKEATTR